MNVKSNTNPIHFNELFKKKKNKEFEELKICKFHH